MKKIIKSLSLFVFMILAAVPSFAQDETQMADVMRSNGKIYVLVAVMLILIVGISVYLFLLDRKITRLEQKFDDNK